MATKPRHQVTATGAALPPPAPRCECALLFGPQHDEGHGNCTQPAIMLVQRGSTSKNPGQRLNVCGYCAGAYVPIEEEEADAKA